MAFILVTGGLGYLGGRIAAHLAGSGHTVTATSRRAATRSPAWLPHMRVLDPDWDDAQALSGACAGVDCIVHLAAMNEVYSARDPVGALRANGVASLQLLQAAQAAGVKRFIYFSTAHVYGSPLVGRITETTLARPQHPYAITHRVTEDFVLGAHDTGRIEGVVLRLSNGFGAPMSADVDRWTLLVNDLCRQAVTSGEMKLQSAGTQLRDFITLEDVARGVGHLVALERASLSDGLFNLGDRSASILEMAQRVANRAQILLGREVPIHRPEAGAPGAPLDYVSDKIRGTGFSPASRFDEEIDATLQLCMRAFGGQG